MAPSSVLGFLEGGSALCSCFGGAGAGVMAEAGAGDEATSSLALEKQDPMMNEVLFEKK